MNNSNKNPFVNNTKPSLNMPADVLAEDVPQDDKEDFDEFFDDEKSRKPKGKKIKKMRSNYDR